MLMEKITRDINGEYISSCSVVYVGEKSCIKSLTPLSGSHLRCACLCANKCKEIEQEFIDGNTTQKESDLFQEDMAYSIGAIMASVAFLESTINEFFQEFFYKFDNLTINKSYWMDLKTKWDEDAGRIQKMKKTLADKYGYSSKEIGDQSELITKYEIAHQILFNKQLDKSCDACVDFGNLIHLRNQLVHFKLKWQTTHPEEEDLYIMRLRFENKFKKNVFMEKSGNCYFPDKCLGAGCAEWSIFVSTKFLNLFSNTISESGIDLLKPHINRIIQEYSFSKT
jgi:hypothetical protein